MEGATLTGFPPGIEVLEVTGGQDRGARFALHGGEAILGRAPTADVMLTDPGVAHRHARLRLAGGRLRLEDLGTDGGTRVNGAPLDGAGPLAAGDRIALGDTELTVRWTPERAPGTPPGWPAAAPPPPTPPAAVPAPPPPAGPPRPPPRPGPPAAAGGLALIGLISLWVPVLDGGADARSVWAVGFGGLRALALAAVLVAAAGAAVGVGAALGRRPPLPEAVPPLGIAAGGGVLLGIALLLATADVGGSDRRAGVLVLLVVAAGLVAAGAAGVAVRAPARRLPALTDVRGALVVAGALAGGAMAGVATGLTWVTTDVSRLGGFDAGVLTARGLLPLAFATAGAGLMAAAAGARVGRREGALAAAVTAALGAAVLAFGVAAADLLQPLALGPAAGVTVAGGAVTLVLAVAGTLRLASRRV